MMALAINPDRHISITWFVGHRPLLQHRCLRSGTLKRSPRAQEDRSNKWIRLVQTSPLRSSSRCRCSIHFAAFPYPRPQAPSASPPQPSNVPAAAWGSSDGTSHGVQRAASVAVDAVQVNQNHAVQPTQDRSLARQGGMTPQMISWCLAATSHGPTSRLPRVKICGWRMKSRRLMTR